MIITRNPFKHNGNPAVALPDPEESDVCKCISIVLGNKSIASTLISKWFNWRNLHALIYILAYFQQILQWHKEDHCFDHCTKRSVFLCWSYFMLSSKHSSTLILLRTTMKVLSPFYLITLGSCTIKNTDQNLKKSPYVLLYFSNIWDDLVGGNCNKSTTAIIDNFENAWLSRQPNISYNLLCI